MTRDDWTQKVFGRSSRRTAIQLIVACILVGAVLALIGLSPGEFWRAVFDGFRRILGFLGDSLGEIVVNLATYLLLGAAIVLPIWLLSRILTGGGKKVPEKQDQRDADRS